MFVTPWLKRQIETAVSLQSGRMERMRVHDHVRAMLHNSWLEQLQDAMARWAGVGFQF